MYYVVTPDRPYPNDKLHHGSRFVQVTEWAKTTASTQGIALDVRRASTGEISASYDAFGHNIPVRDE